VVEMPKVLRISQLNAPYSATIALLTGILNFEAKYVHNTSLISVDWNLRFKAKLPHAKLYK
jgi:hypothetical protein